MTDKKITTSIPQDDLLKLVLDGGTIKHKKTAEDGYIETIEIHIEEVEGLLNDEEVFKRIDRLAKQ